jgi:hypothetical protein
MFMIDATPLIGKTIADVYTDDTDVRTHNIRLLTTEGDIIEISAHGGDDVFVYVDVYHNVEEVVA